MRSWTTQALLERLVTAYSCEVPGCFGPAVWLISFDDEASHLCARHTRTYMRTEGRWGDVVSAGIGE